MIQEFTLVLLQTLLVIFILKNRNNKNDKLQTTKQFLMFF